MVEAHPSAQAQGQKHELATLRAAVSLILIKREYDHITWNTNINVMLAPLL